MRHGMINSHRPMIVRRIASHRVLSSLLLVGICFGAATVRAHSPFDSTAHLTVMEQSLEASLVVGSGLSDKLLQDSGVPAIPNTGVGMGTTLPITLATRLFEIETAGTNLPATRVRVLSDGLESTFVVTYPRPATDSFRLRAAFAKHLPASGFSALVVTDDQNRMLGSHIVRQGSETAEFSLPKLPGTGSEIVAASATAETTTPAATVTSAPAPIAKPQPSFVEYFQMGVHHILTGPDHLLFLCGLLVVSRKFKDVLGIVTCFTLAHSVTLGLAALNVVSLSTKIVEPVIAASIIFVGVENFRRDNSVTARCCLAFGFGLIHGFGLADALRGAGLGTTIKTMATGLFSFNVGVEAGQLAVAGIFLAVLWQLRKQQHVERYATPVISALIIALGCWWLVQRTLL